MKENSLLQLQTFGQSIWMDFIRRGTISSGELKQLIEEDGLSGMTSNPSIFEKAIAGSHDYDDAIRKLALQGESVDQIYAALTVEDIQRSADLFRPIYDRLDGSDGFVSLEVSPYLARDTDKTIADARRLWVSLARPNVMIKVPATLEGLPAIQQLIGEGININITLLFGLSRYRQVAEAYIAGLETLAAKGKPLKSVASVASFFLSRIDVLLDPMLEKTMAINKSKADLAASFQHAVVSQLVDTTSKVARELHPKNLIVAGGVACNLALRGSAENLARNLSIPVYFPSKHLSTDNAAMIAAAAYPKLLRGETAPLSMTADVTLRLQNFENEDLRGSKVRYRL